MDYQEIGLFAKQIVKEAGELLKQLQKQPLQLEEKKDFTDLVTVVDKQIETFLVQKIIEQYPDHGILGEEGVFDGDLLQCEFIWIIDPIDGTTNFIQGLPFYGISVGIVHENEAVIGTVYNPTTDELFYGVKGSGAFVNDTPLRVSETLKLQDAVLSVMFIWEDETTKERFHPALIELYKESRAIRVYGDATISLCEIAKGSVNAYFYPDLSPWDYAGGLVIAKEAGAIGTGLQGEEIQFRNEQSILVAHPAIHEELVKKFLEKK